MYTSRLFGLAASVLLTISHACPIIERSVVEAGNTTIEARQSCPKYDYKEQGRNWASQCSAWSKCGNGRQQSPINLPANSFAKTHTPVFAFPGGATRGEIFNRGFGPEWLPEAGVAVPTLRFDGTTYNLLQWHTHTPESEHAFGGNKQRAEIHFVFGTGSTPKAVAGIGLMYGQASRFFGDVFQQLDSQGRELPPIGSTERAPVRIDFSTGILSSNHFRDYWTYSGSLTTPGCGEGVRWFLGGWTHALSGDQFPRLDKVSIDSVRALQPVLDQQINV